MALEIEYRYLLAAMPDLGDVTPIPLIQGYLSTHPDRAVRIRLIGESSAKITIKGHKTGAVAQEFEYDIPVADAQKMLDMCGADNIISKDRYEWCAPDNFIWEIDRFKGRHDGLVIAELEVPSPETAYEKPHWLHGVDITADPRFANASLATILRRDMVSYIAEALKKPAL